MTIAQQKRPNVSLKKLFSWREALKRCKKQTRWYYGTSRCELCLECRASCCNCVCEWYNGSGCALMRPEDLIYDDSDRLLIIPLLDAMHRAVQHRIDSIREDMDK